MASIWHLISQSLQMTVAVLIGWFYNMYTHLPIEQFLLVEPHLNSKEKDILTTGRCAVKVSITNRDVTGLEVQEGGRSEFSPQRYLCSDTCLKQRTSKQRDQWTWKAESQHADTEAYLLCLNHNKSQHPWSVYLVPSTALNTSCKLFYSTLMN